MSAWVQTATSRQASIVSVHPPTVDIRKDEGNILPFSGNLFPVPCPAERRRSDVFRMLAKKLIKSEGTVTDKPEWAGLIAENFFPGPHAGDLDQRRRP
jgi:hypothetical protein